ncbi:MAG: amidohydrolase family protein [bacterium]|nr:amidohydrolase family protein [bacterium]
MDAQLPKIDVHHHIVPREYVEALAGIGVTEVAGRPFPEWSVENMLELMDRHQIRAAITSISAPGVYFGDEGFTIELCRRCNEFSAQLVKKYPERLGAYAVLPLPNVDAALKELEYALDILRLDGVALLSSVGRYYMGAPCYDELFAALNARRAVVFMHPDVSPESDKSTLKLPPSLVEFVLETTKAVSNLLFTGTIERCPAIRFILPHAGGAIPYLTLRLTLGQFWPGLQEQVPQGIQTYLSRFYYDTAISAAPYALRSLQEVVDNAQILFASDYPFAPELATMATINGLETYDGFDEQALRSVFYDNALRLFPRFKKGA